jgi:hypothetical protein
MPNRLNTKLVLMLLLLCVACDTTTQTATSVNYPDDTSERFVLYKEKCSVCHAPPLPSRYKAKQWPQILERMQMRMTRISIKPLDEKQKSIILGYLQEFAKS